MLTHILVHRCLLIAYSETLYCPVGMNAMMDLIQF